MKDIYSGKSKRDRERATSPQYTLLRGEPMPAPNLLITTNPLQQAVFRGCVECIQVLVETPPYFSVDAPCGPEGLRPIHIAAREGHLQSLRYLSSAGACIQKCDGNGLSPLHYGVLGGQLRAVRWLLRHGAKICVDKRGRSPLQLATDHDHMEIVALLTKHTSCGTPLGLLPSSQPTSHTSSSTSTPSTTTTILVHSHHQPPKEPAYTPAHPPNQKKKSKSNNGRGQDKDPVLTPEDSKSSPIQDSSSSGNSSLATTSGSNSPSLSPSATCSCSESTNSDDYSAAPTQKIGGKSSRCSSSSFYLHPPKSSFSKSSSPKTTPSPTSPTPTSFYLHPPSTPTQGLLIENPNPGKTSVHFAEESFPVKMAPVTPVSATDFIPPKEGDEEKLRAGTVPAPTPTPSPPPSKHVRIVSPDPPVPPEKHAVSFSPPPPPPMPKFDDKAPPTLPLKRPVQSSLKPPSATLKPINGLRPQPPNCSTDQNDVEENDYEDIDEIHDHVAQYEETNLVNGNTNRKLNRSISAPPTETVTPHKVLQGALGLGRQRVPFIPPNFPDPPQDALIKPSEYLKSIQQSQGKPKYGKTPPPLPSYATGGGSAGAVARSSTRVEEAIKMLSGQESGSNGGMPPVPEETNAEDEFEEINPERINGNPKLTLRANGQGAESSAGGGGIKAEELMKVNLRKTPMSRTKSAPPLGRVLPDNISPSTPTPGQNCSPEDMRKVNELNNLCNGKPNSFQSSNSNGSTSTQAAVIAELAESSQVGGVREWKEELRRRQQEQDKNAAQEMASYYSPLNFVSEVPDTDGDGVPIPPWKRQMMAKKAAEKARKDAEEQRKLEVEAKRLEAIPPWRRQLLQRRDSDGKYAQ